MSAPDDLEPLPTPPAPSALAGRARAVPRPAAPPSPRPAQEPVDPARWGRVDAHGTVFVRTADGERPVGQYPEGTPEEALSFFAKRFEALVFEVGLLEQRVHAAALSPEQARSSIVTLAQQIDEAAAVGDFVGLRARLDALHPVIGAQQQSRREDKARRLSQALERKDAIVAEAEKLATSKDWRAGDARLRALLEEWKALPRLDKPSDNALWQRFSAARTTYHKARRAHFAGVSEQRESARVIKERLAAEAEELAGSTKWGPTSTRFRALMQEWKSAGGAPRDVEEALWQRFRGAQDTFFTARDAANTAQDEEFTANATVKRELLEKAEKLVPVTDLDAAKRAFRALAEQWDTAGKVPREQVNSLESRMRKVEQTIRTHEEHQWKRSDPEKSARADDVLAQLTRAIAALESDLAGAEAAGDGRGVDRIRKDLESRRAFLEMAQRAAADFS